MLNEKINKWKLAFWICFAALALVTSFLSYSIIDQAVTLTYQKEGYSDTEGDLEQLIKLLNNTDLTKKQIQGQLKSHRLYQYMDFNSDTISLERVLIVFKNNKLIKIEKQW